MKKLLLVPMIIALAIFTSCALDTDDNRAEATLYHAGVVESYDFTDTLNKVYAKYITKALENDSIVGIPFKHEAEVNIASYEYAEMKCDEYAYEDYIDLLKRKKITLDEIKRIIFSSSYPNDTTFEKIIKGCEKYSDLDLKPFMVNINLINLKYGKSIYKESIYVK